MWPRAVNVLFKTLQTKLEAQLRKGSEAPGQNMVENRICSYLEMYSVWGVGMGGTGNLRMIMMSCVGFTFDS